VTDASWETRGTVGAFQDGYIIDPAGNRTTEAQLANYAFIMQYAAYLASLDPGTQREFYRLLGQT
jgi:hypothetical protein